MADFDRLAGIFCLPASHRDDIVERPGSQQLYATRGVNLSKNRDVAAAILLDIEVDLWFGKDLGVAQRRGDLCAGCDQCQVVNVNAANHRYIDIAIGVDPQINRVLGRIKNLHAQQEPRPDLQLGEIFRYCSWGAEPSSDGRSVVARSTWRRIERARATDF